MVRLSVRNSSECARGIQSIVAMWKHKFYVSNNNVHAGFRMRYILFLPIYCSSGERKRKRRATHLRKNGFSINFLFHRVQITIQ